MTSRHRTAVHEAGHAVVALDLDCTVARVMVMGPGLGTCRWIERNAARLALPDEAGLRKCCAWADRNPGRGGLDLEQACRQLASRGIAGDPYVRGGAPCVAGAVAEMLARLAPGSNSIPLQAIARRVSREDRAIYDRFAHMSPDAPERFFQACVQVAADTLTAHRPAFLALVDALLEHGELGETEILAIWQPHAEAA